MNQPNDTRTPRNRNQRLLAFTGLAMLAVLFFAINIVADGTLRGSRLDLTQNRLFTLSDGTRNILGDLNDDLTLRLYYSSSLAGQVPEIRNHANRVMSMLEEFRSLSNGRIRLEVIDPEPFSEAEDRAVAAGLAGVPLGGTGDRFYFGLVGQNMTDDQETIGFFQPERERFLEYDLTRLVHALAKPEKPHLMVITTYPLEFGPGGIQAAMRGESKAYGIMEPLRQFFDVSVPLRQWETIDKGTDVLLIAHARGLTPKQLYAIDQFILGGGKALILADVFSETGARLPPPGGAPNPMDTHDSLLPELFGPWGIRIEPEKLVADRTLATRVNVARGRRQLVDYVAWLQAGKNVLNQDDPVTADLQLPLLLPSVGHIQPAEDTTLTVTPLITSTTDAMLIESPRLRFRPDPEQLLADFKPENQQYVIGARITGPLKSAFDKAPEGVEAPHLAQSTGDVSMIVIADADLIDDNFWLSRQNMFGQQVMQPTSGNANLIINALDNLSGSSDLISLRSRGESDRPFAVIEDLRKSAEQRYLAEEKALSEKLSETEQKLAELQSQAGENAGQLLSAEEAQTIESFQAEVVATRRQLRGVQHSLRKDIEDLQNRIRLIDIAAVPALVFLAALVLALIRRSRRRASQNVKEA